MDAKSMKNGVPEGLGWDLEPHGLRGPKNGGAGALRVTTYGSLWESNGSQVESEWRPKSHQNVGSISKIIFE